MPHSGTVDHDTAVAKIIVQTEERQDEATHIEARDNDSGTLWQAYPPYNLNHASFRELDRRVEAGTVVLEFHTPLGTFDSQAIPIWAADHVLQRNPFARVQQTLTIDQDDELTNTIWYKRAATAPSLPAGLSDGSINGLSVTTDSVMTAAGWSKQPPDGTDSLYYTLVTFSVVGGDVAAEGTAPDTDDIQYSTDYGETWVDAVPDDYDSVTDIRYYVNGNPGLWAVETLKTEVIDPLIHFGGTIWQNGGNGNDDFDQYIDVAANTNLLEDNYDLGFTIREVASWSDHRANQEGSCRMPVDAIVLTTPERYEAVDSDGRVPYSTYLMKQARDGGEATIGLSHPDTRLSDYSSNDWGTYFVHFISYPQTLLSEAVTAAATSIYIDSVAGMTAGNTLYIGSERMRIVSIGERDAAHGNGYLVIVDRAHSGTTAAAHGDNASVRAIVNKNAVRYYLIGKRRGVLDRTWIKPWRVRKRGAA